MSSNIVINPFSKASSINSFYINEILNLGLVLDDRSSVGKMRDAYPVSLFNFQSALIFLENNKFKAFSYILIFGFWNEESRWKIEIKIFQNFKIDEFKVQ